jgi:uncharacterized protein (TIGR02145 family)
MDASQRTGIGSPATGLLVYQTDAPAGFYYYNGTGWISLGTGEGAGSQLIDADGNAYPTVRIGNQEWMAENLRVTHYRNGEAIPIVMDGTAWGILTTGARCYYNNDSAANNPVYGPLYNWYTVNDSRNLCPSGWHVPTDAEWNLVAMYLGGANYAGGKMKAAILWNSPNNGATNTSGFSGLPGGYRNTITGIGIYEGMVNLGFWWSSTQNSATDAKGRRIYYITTALSVNIYNITNGFSVRCLKD